MTAYHFNLHIVSYFLCVILDKAQNFCCLVYFSVLELCLPCSLCSMGVKKASKILLLWIIYRDIMKISTRLQVACMRDTFDRARTRPKGCRPSARATIGYLVYKAERNKNYCTYQQSLKKLDSQKTWIADEVLPYEIVDKTRLGHLSFVIRYQYQCSPIHDSCAACAKESRTKDNKRDVLANGSLRPCAHDVVRFN